MVLYFIFNILLFANPVNTLWGIFSLLLIVGQIFGIRQRSANTPRPEKQLLWLLNIITMETKEVQTEK